MPILPRVNMVYSPFQGSQNGTFWESNGRSVSIGSSRMKRHVTASWDATAKTRLPFQTMPLYFSSGVASGFPSRNGTRSVVSPSSSSQTMLLSVEPSNSIRPREGRVHVMPSLLSA